MGLRHAVFLASQPWAEMLQAQTAGARDLEVYEGRCLGRVSTQERATFN